MKKLTREEIVEQTEDLLHKYWEDLGYYCGKMRKPDFIQKEGIHPDVAFEFIEAVHDINMADKSVMG